MAQAPAMAQAMARAMTGTQPPGDLMPPQGTPGDLMPPQGTPVLLGHIDTPQRSNERIYSAGQTAEA